MKFECDSCGANYMIADEKVGKRGVKVKCKRCSHVIIVRPEAAAAEEDLPDPSVELSASEATPPETPPAEAGSPDASAADEGGVFGSDTEVAGAAGDDDETATTVGHFPGFSNNSGDDVDLGSMAGARDDDDDDDAQNEDAWASSGDGDGADETTGLAAASSGEDDAEDDDAQGEEDTLAAHDDDRLAVTDDEDHDARTAAGEADDAWSVSGGGEPVPEPPSMGDDDDDDDDDAWSTSGDDDVPPPPGLDADEGFSPHDEKTSVGGVPGWNMSGENDTQMGAMPDVTDPNMQLPSMPDVGGLDDDDGGDVPVPPGMAGEDDALNALAGMSAGADDASFGGDMSLAGDLPVPPELDAGDLPPEGDAAMPESPVQGEESDAFDAQLAGAFSNMFGDAPSGDPNAPQEGAFADDLEGFRGPTQVLEAPQMDALREQAIPSDEGYRDNTNETYTSSLDAAYSTLGGSMDTAMGDPIGGDMPTQMADIEADEGGWHVAIDDEDVGPLSLHEIADHIQGGRVDRDSLVWRTGMDDWEPAGDVPQMAQLFDALPMPKIDAGFDVGAPIDDMGGPPPGADPFSNVPDVSADPNWQPHGLTDVYQAANLAEAAGLGLPKLGKSNGAAVKDDDDDDGEWRPGAAGALAALVEDEINRIDSDPIAEVSSPGLAPADDAGPGMFADGAGAGAEVGGLSSAPSSAGFPAGGFGAVGGLSTPGLSTPAMPMGGLSSPALSSPAMAQVPTVDTYPPQAAMSGFAPVQPPAPQKSMVPWIVGGVVVVVLLLVVGIAATAAIVVSMNNSQPVVAADGTPSTDDSAKDNETKVAVASDTKKDDTAADTKADDTKADDTKADDTKADDAKADDTTAADQAKTDDPKADDKDAVAADEKGDKDDKAEPAADEKDDKKDVKVASAKTDSKKSSRSRSSGRKAEKRKTVTRDPTPPPPKREPKKREKRKRVSKRGDCDPILDIDCDEKKSKKKSSGGGDVKDKLSKSDILVVVKQNIGSIKRCFTSNGVNDTVKMEWKISKSGRTSGVRVLTPKYAGTPMGRCMTNAVKRFKFPKYSGAAPPPIKFPFKP
jgi:predicted Zn finger-like uncharacterized protein